MKFNKSWHPLIAVQWFQHIIKPGTDLHLMSWSHIFRDVAPCFNLYIYSMFQEIYMQKYIFRDEIVVIVNRFIIVRNLWSPWFVLNVYNFTFYKFQLILDKCIMFEHNVSVVIYFNCILHAGWLVFMSMSQ